MSGSHGRAPPAALLTVIPITGRRERRRDQRRGQARGRPSEQGRRDPDDDPAPDFLFRACAMDSASTPRGHRWRRRRRRAFDGRSAWSGRGGPAMVDCSTAEGETWRSPSPARAMRGQVRGGADGRTRGVLSKGRGPPHPFVPPRRRKFVGSTSRASWTAVEGANEADGPLYRARPEEAVAEVNHPGTMKMRPRGPRSIAAV